MKKALSASSTDLPNFSRFGGGGGRQMVAHHGEARTPDLRGNRTMWGQDNIISLTTTFKTTEGTTEGTASLEVEREDSIPNRFINRLGIFNI